MDHTEKTDGELIESSQEGDTSAFGELVHRYSDRVYAFALRLSADKNMAEDALQETFIKVWKNRRRFKQGKSFSPWLLSIARNATFDLMRKRRDRSFSSMRTTEDEENFGEGIEDDSVSIPESFDRAVLGRVLEETLDTLSPNQRAAVILHDIEGLTFAEAGKAMGKPLNTVKSHYRRAIAALRERLCTKRDT